MASNKNILHNWDFRNPVNQRGLSSYSAEGYTIDRWTSPNSGVTTNVNSGNLSVAFSVTSAQWYQKLEGSLFAGTYTLSFDGHSSIANSIRLIGNNIGDWGYIYLPTSRGIVSWTFTIANDAANVSFGLFSQLVDTATIFRAKLELGSVSTLENDPPADFGEQLTLCQRYYELYAIYFSTSSMRDGNHYNIPMTYMVPKRITPNITLVVDSSVGVTDITIETSGIGGSGFNNGNYNNYRCSYQCTNVYNCLFRIHGSFSADL